MPLDSEFPRTQEPFAHRGAQLRLWIGRAVIACLISASTFILLLCPCDRPAGSFYATFLVSLSGIFALAAAAVLYRDLRKDAGATGFISAFKAAGIVAIAVYLELRVAVVIVEWMARYAH